MTYIKPSFASYTPRVKQPQISSFVAQPRFGIDNTQVDPDLIRSVIARFQPQNALTYIRNSAGRQVGSVGITDEGNLVIHIEGFNHPVLRQAETQLFNEPLNIETHGPFAIKTLRLELNPRSGHVTPHIRASLYQIQSSAIPAADYAAEAEKFLRTLVRGKRKDDIILVR